MKIAVYGIAKNEAKHVKRFMHSAQAADGIFILDTGSTDDTFAEFQQLGAHVSMATPRPFKFHEARNEALSLVPGDYDVCISLDIDEILHEGWRREILRSFIPGVTHMLRNKHILSASGDFMWTQRIHSRMGWEWRHPIHEALYWIGTVPFVEVYNHHLLMEHKQDFLKDRSQYLPMLEAGAAEDPSPRMLYYLAREYSFKQRWDDCINTCYKYLEHPGWPEEHAQILCLLGTAKGHLSYGGSKSYFKEAIALVPHIRDPWVKLAHHCWAKRDWVGGYLAARKALEITQREEKAAWGDWAWGVAPYDIAGLCAYEMKIWYEAQMYFQQAVNLAPTDQRLKDNLEWANRKLRGE